MVGRAAVVDPAAGLSRADGSDQHRRRPGPGRQRSDPAERWRSGSAGRRRQRSLGQDGGDNGGGFNPGGSTTVDVGTGHAFTDNAPTWYAWLPADAGSVWKYAGLGLVALVTAGCAAFLLRLRRPLTAGEILLVAASSFIIPILLPEMHERYFYLAEVLTVLATFVNRGFVAVAACLQAATITTYLGYLLRTAVLALPWAAVIAGVAAVAAVVLMVVHLRRGSRVAASPTPAMIS